MQEIQSIRSVYSSLIRSKHNSYSQGINLISSINSRSSISKPKSKAEASRIAAKKHSEAERRRRVRINGQYATLRAVLPNLSRMDKASVLTETVRRIVELKKATSHLESMTRGNGECIIPNAADKLSLSYCDGEQQGLVKVTISCEDRLGLIGDLTRTVKSMKGRVVKAEMVVVGGRSKFVLFVQGLDGGNEGLVVLRRALKVVIDNSFSPRRFHLFH